MVTARDDYDWYEDDERFQGPEHDRASGPSRRLGLVRRPELSFQVIAPDDFEDAQMVADRLRAGAPVIIDFHGVDRELAGRLTDFASGLVYAIEGTLQYVGREVLLLTPSNVDLSGDEASAVREPGFYNRS
jgi:cell division inhibitor SepF